MKRLYRFSFASVLLATVVTAAHAQTNGYLLSCTDASRLGRGCTTLSGRDPAGLLAHPAGLSRVGARALSLGGAAFLPAMDYTNAVNAVTPGEDNIFPLPAVFFADRTRGKVTLGAGIQTLGGMGADYQLTHALLGAGQRYHSKFGLMRGGLAAGYALTPRLSVGVTLGTLYGQMEFATPYAVDPSQLAGMAGLGADPDYAPLLSGFTEAVAYAELTGLQGFSLSAGASIEYRATERLRLALAWTPPATITLKGGAAAMDMTAQFGALYQAMVAAKNGDAATVNSQLAGMGIDMPLGMATTFGAQLDIGVPQTVTLSLGLDPAPRWNVAMDLGWIGWKRAFRNMPLRMVEGTNPNINILMNGSPADGGFATSWPLAWKDTWTARLGIEYTASQTLTLRAGGIHGANPVSAEGLFTIFPAIVQTSATLGAGYQVGRTTINLAYALTFKNEQDAAPAHLVASEYANSSSHLSESTFSLGLDWRW